MLLFFLKIIVVRYCTLHMALISARIASFSPVGIKVRFTLKARHRCCRRSRTTTAHLRCTLISACLCGNSNLRIHPAVPLPSNTQYSSHPQVTEMLDESKGTLRLARDGLGDERVPSLSLERLKEAYRTGRGSVSSWRATASSTDGGTYVTSCSLS